MLKDVESSWFGKMVSFGEEISGYEMFGVRFGQLDFPLYSAWLSIDPHIPRTGKACRCINLFSRVSLARRKGSEHTKS